MQCYSHYRPENGRCRQCRERRWCETAGDPPLINDRQQEELRTPGNLEMPENPPSIAGEKLRYSRSDMMELIGFLLSLDYSTLEFLDEKLRNPDVSFESMGKDRRITKQAVHKFIKQRCERIPELAVVLQNRRQRNRAAKTTTFGEEVWKIRKETQEMRLKTQENTLPRSKNLTCLSRSLDLSRMSIFKGGRICLPN
ncbi:MAG: hypothetical protein PHS41_08990 [Victivallaceae bacterium]|nr:hypothetical protein [Victivallaceae bacterium]